MGEFLRGYGVGCVLALLAILLGSLAYVTLASL